MAQTRSKPQRKRKPPRGRDRSDYNEPLTPEQEAAVWVLAEEGRSHRAIAAELGNQISRSAVGKVLGKDPVRLESLRAALREERSTLWKRLETEGLVEAVAWIGELRAFRKQGNKLSAKGLGKLAILPRIIQATRAAAGEASRQVQLLTGGVTERLGKDPDGQDANPEQLVQMAIEAGLVDRLPPKLREYAEAQEARERMSKATGIPLRVRGAQ